MKKEARIAKMERTSHFVRIEDIFEKLPLSIYTCDGILKEVIRIAIIGQTLVFHARRNITFSVDNARMHAYVRIPDSAIDRLRIPRYSEQVYSLTDKRPVFVEKNGTIEKILYTKEDDDRYLEDWKKKQKAMCLLGYERILLDMKIAVGTYSRTSIEYIYRNLSETLIDLQQWCSKEEFSLHEQRFLRQTDKEKCIQDTRALLAYLFHEIEACMQHEEYSGISEATQQKILLFCRWLEYHGASAQMYKEQYRRYTQRFT